VLGKGLGARLDFIVAVMAWLLALHGLALPSIRDLLDVMVHEYSGKSISPLEPAFDLLQTALS
jgi:hypothetical protein